MIRFLKSHFIRILNFVFYTFLVFYSRDHIFFWDTIQLGSMQAHFFFENNFHSFLIPNRIDSGHIPSFGIYLALLWNLFGKTLLVSHMAMLPFVWGIVWQSYLLLKKFIPEVYQGMALFIFLADPTLLSQLTLVSPDVPLVFFFLLALNALIRNQRWYLMMAVLGLFLISLRGVMVSAAILVIDLFINCTYKDTKSAFLSLIRNSYSYLPGFLIFIGYSFYHYSSKGWIGYHDDSPWASFFEKVSVSGVLRNIMILGWRLLDFGRVFTWIIAVILGLVYWKQLFKNKTGKTLAIIFLATFLSLAGQIIWFNNLVAHRYLLPVFLTFTLMATYFLYNFIISKRIKIIISIIWLFGLITGNFWVYPDKVAQGWDSTLAHLPYYELRSEMIGYLDSNNINIEEVGSDFPMTGKFKYLDLSDSQIAFPEKDLDTHKFVIYSNIFNDFSDGQIDELQLNWKVVHKIERNHVFLVLYENPKK